VIGWLLRLVLILILVRLVWRFLANVMYGLTGSEPRVRPRAGDPVPLVKDPVCGTYVVKAKALAARTNDETAWFCSEACRDTWRSSHTGARSA
jgi:YHS domain-containing protein